MSHSRYFFWRGVPGAVLLRYAYDLCGYSLLALPLLNATAASGIGEFPEPARQLFLDGGLWLLELIRIQQASLLASVAPTASLLGLLAFGTIVPEWWLLTALARSRDPATSAPAAAALARLSVLALASWTLRALVWGAALWFGLQLRASLVAFPDERLADLALLAVLGSCLLLQLGLSLVRDAIATSVVSARLPLRAALAHAPHAARRHWRGASARYALYRVLSLAVLVGAEALATLLGGNGGTLPAVGFAAHQLGLLLRVLAHTAWLCWLVHLLAEPRPAQADAFL